MHDDNLKFLFREYKNCMKSEFSEYFGKDDEYKSYHGRCLNQTNEIQKYLDSHLNKIFYLMPEREEIEVSNKYQSKLKRFAAYGWTSEQIKN